MLNRRQPVKRRPDDLAADFGSKSFDKHTTLITHSHKTEVAHTSGTSRTSTKPRTGREQHMPDLLIRVKAFWKFCPDPGRYLSPTPYKSPEVSSMYHFDVPTAVDLSV